MKMVEEKLGNGKVYIYDFGNIKLHAYETKDVMNDTAYIIETENELTGIETPGFFEDLNVYNGYILKLDKPLNHLFLAYHSAVPENFTGKIYATENYVQSVTNGSIKGLLDKFAVVFGSTFDTRVPKVTNVINEGKVNVSGIDFVIKNKDDGYIIEIPSLNILYTHMAGSDVHNILPSLEYIDTMINDMQHYRQKNYTLILTSHYKPETIELADIKISYLKSIKEIYGANKNKEDFIKTVKNKYPNYSGENYLQMTADMLYQ